MTWWQSLLVWLLIGGLFVAATVGASAQIYRNWKVTAADSIPSPAAVIHWERWFAAIAQVETGNNPLAVGAAGERTRYQIKPETWARYSRVPMWQASEIDIRHVCYQHLRTIEGALQARGLPVDAHLAALCWRRGEHAIHFQPEDWVYAQRVQNLYWDSNR